jgi:hypothetical protein
MLEGVGEWGGRGVFAKPSTGGGGGGGCMSQIYKCLVRCGVAQLWCGMAQLVARRLAVRQARVRFSARHHREVFPTDLSSDEEMERNLGEWRRINVYCIV